MSNVNRILMIGYVWPEPTATGASVRMMEWIDLFRARQWHITFASPAAASALSVDLSALGVHTQAIEVNDSRFDAFVSQLNPDVVLFDRFMMEEQFGWRVRKNCPDALHVLETIDLHCLREARHHALKAGHPFVLTDLHSEIAKREIAAIYRCDLSVLISDYEMEILQSFFHIDASLLHHCPFMLDATSASNTLPSFGNRQHFMTIGNFRHAPNWDAVLWLKQEIWPLIRQQMPRAELHIYGAYTPPKATALHHAQEGFFIQDRAESVDEVMQQARICLAPLRFGAGIKTKLADAMRNGTPSVVTSIAAEGMTGGLSWPGAIADQAHIFADKAVQMYAHKDPWLQAQHMGFSIVHTHFNRHINQENLFEAIIHIQANLSSHRQRNFIGGMLNHHQHRSTEFMSRWIEEKTKHIHPSRSLNVCKNQ